MVLKKPLRNFFPNFKSVLKLVPTTVAMRKMASPERMFKTKTLQFIVDRTMNKITFREFIQKTYGIEVKEISSVNMPGKAKRNLKKGYTKNSDYKKMFIKVPDWIDVPYAPRSREELENSISDTDGTDYNDMFVRPRLTRAEIREIVFANRQKKIAYDPSKDRSLQPKRRHRVPTRDRSDD